MANHNSMDMTPQGGGGTTTDSVRNNKGSGAGGHSRGVEAGRGVPRRGNRNRRNQERKTSTAAQLETKFEGKTSEMAGHVFQTQKESSVPRQFKKTMEQLEHWVGLKTKFPEDLKPIFGDEITPLAIDVPADLAEVEKKSAARVRLWEKRVDMTAKREMALKTSLKQLYTVVWGQCTEAMKAQICADKDYPDIDSVSDVVSLLKIILGICYSHKSSKEVNRAVHDALKGFYSFSQGEHMSVTEYYEEYLIRIDVVEVYSGTDVWNSSSLITEALLKDGKYSPNITATDLLLDEETTPDYFTYAVSAREKYLAMSFLRGSDPKRFGKLLADLDNNYYARNQHQYPSSIEGAYDYLITYTDPSPGHKQQRHEDSRRIRQTGNTAAVPALTDENQQDEVTFLQSAGVDLTPT